MTHYTVSIVSDTVCPWCYVGYRRLSKAIASHVANHPDDTFSTIWKPFQLNPDFPKDQPMSKEAYYQKRFGSQGIQGMYQRLTPVAQAEGINISYGGKIGNTRDSHRLIAAALEQDEQAAKETNGTGAAVKGAQTKLAEELFADYFEREQDISSLSVLSAAAERAGMGSEGEIRKMLEGNAHGSEVDKEVKEARSGGISGVPFFVINDKYAVEGAQEPQAFQTLFERIKKKNEAARA